MAALLSISFDSLAEQWSCSAEQEMLSEHCFYVGAGFGLSNFSKLDDSDSPWKIDNKSSQALQLVVGYQFMARWFAEFSYGNLGSMDVVNPFIQPAIKADISFSSLSFLGGYYVPITWLTFGAIEQSNIQPFVKAGLANVSSNSSDKSIGLDQGASVKLQIALGADWRFLQDWQLRAQWENISETANVTSLAVNYLFSFGSNKRSESSNIAHDTSENAVAGYSAIPHVKFKARENKISYKTLVFSPNSASLEAKSLNKLRQTKQVLDKYPHLRVVIQVADQHKSTLGTSASISQQRATALKRNLIKLGVSAKRINARSSYNKPLEPYHSSNFYGKQVSVDSIVFISSYEDIWIMFNR